MADEQVGPGLYVKLGLDTSGMIGNIGGVSLAINQTLNLLGKFERVGQEIINLANKAGQFGKEIKDNARDLGLSTQQFQQWTHAAIASGSSAEEITGSIRMMSVRMKEAADPTSEMGKAIANLGVKVTDSKGKMRSMNDILLDIFPALNALPEGFARNQASMTIFGRSFSNIADLASLSRGELQKLMDQAPVFSQEKIDKLDAYHTKMALLNEKIGLIYVNIGEKLVPVLENSLIPAFESAQPAISDFIKAIDYLGEAIDRAATGYAILKDPGNWEKISEKFMERQAAREWSRNFQEIEDWAAQNPNYDPFGMSKNPLFAKKPSSSGPPYTGTTGGGTGGGGAGGAETYANNQLGMQKKYEGRAVYDGVEGTWRKGVFYPDVGAPVAAAKPPTWLEQIGAKYKNGGISQYAPGISHREQDLAAEVLQRQTSPAFKEWREQKEQQKVDVNIKLEFNTPEMAKLFKVTMDRELTRNRMARGYQIT